MANDASKIRVAGGGKIYHAPLLTALPTDTTTAPNVAFLDTGYISDEGLTIDPEEATADIRAWGGDLVRRVVSEFGLSVTFTFLEHNDNTVPAYWGNGDAEAWEMKSSEVRKAWLLHVTDGSQIHRLVLPDAAVTDRGAVTYTTTEAIAYPITLSTFPNATGVHGFGYATAAP